MTSDKTPRQNRIREVLGRLYDQHPPHFREYVRRFEEDPTSRVFAPLAEAYRRMGRVDEAIQICKVGLEHHPDFHGGRVALAKCYLDKKDPASASEELLQVTKAVPENLLAQRLLGDAHLLLGNRADALHAYKMALLLAPSDVALAEKVHKLESGLESSEAEAIEPVKEEISEQEFVEVVPAPVEAPPMPQEENALHEDFIVPSTPAIEEELPSDPGIRSEINALLGMKENEIEDDSFKIQHVSTIFVEPERENRKEITTETLGDLYFSQEQYQRALEIFEKLASGRPSPELARKIALTRGKLGVDQDSLARNRKIEILQEILRRSKANQLESQAV